MSILFRKIEDLFPLYNAFQPQQDLWTYSYRFPEVFEPDAVSRSAQEIEFRVQAAEGAGENVSQMEIDFKLSTQNMLFFLEQMDKLAVELGGEISRLAYFSYRPWLTGEKPFWLGDLASRSDFMVWGVELEKDQLEAGSLSTSIGGVGGSYYSGTLEIAFPIAEEGPLPERSMPVSAAVEGERKVVMLVDDNEATLNLLQTILRTEFLEEELRFIPCNSGIKAFSQAQESKPDMIILDLMMPGKSGFEVLEELKGHEDTRDIPVVILSVIYDEESVKHAEKFGVHRYLVKPFVPFDITRVIREIIFEEPPQA